MTQSPVTVPSPSLLDTSTLIRAERGVPLLARFVTIFLLGGGLVGMTTSFFLLKGAWPWQMPDLAYRFLAGAAAAYAVGSLITLLRPNWPASELLMTTVVLYGIPLALAMVFGRNAVDWGELVAWSFLSLVIPAVAIALLTVAVNWNAARPAEPAIGRELRMTLLVLGILASVVGAWVYLAPRDSGAVWPWAELGPWKPLDTRLLASMLLTIGGGALLVAYRNRWSMAQVFLPMLWAYCVVASIGLAIHADATPAFRTEDITYITIFSIVLVVTALLFILQRQQTRKA